MGVFKDPRGPEVEDLVCAVCATPLLNRKSTCPKCGNRWGQNGVTSEKVRQETYAPYRGVGNVAEGQSAEDLLTASCVFFAGLGFVFAVVSPFVWRVDSQTLWQSFMAVAASLGLLGLRRLLRHQSRG